MYTLKVDFSNSNTKAKNRKNAVKQFFALLEKHASSLSAELSIKIVHWQVYSFGQQEFSTSIDIQKQIDIEVKNIKEKYASNKNEFTKLLKNNSKEFWSDLKAVIGEIVRCYDEEFLDFVFKNDINEAVKPHNTYNESAKYFGDLIRKKIAGLEMKQEGKRLQAFNEAYSKYEKLAEDRDNHSFLSKASVNLIKYCILIYSLLILYFSTQINHPFLLFNQIALLGLYSMYAVTDLTGRVRTRLNVRSQRKRLSQIEFTDHENSFKIEYKKSNTQVHKKKSENEFSKTRVVKNKEKLVEVESEEEQLIAKPPNVSTVRQASSSTDSVLKQKWKVKSLSKIERLREKIANEEIGLQEENIPVEEITWTTKKDGMVISSEDAGMVKVYERKQVESSRGPSEEQLRGHVYIPPDTTSHIKFFKDYQTNTNKSYLCGKNLGESGWKFLTETQLAKLNLDGVDKKSDTVYMFKQRKGGGFSEERYKPAGLLHPNSKKGVTYTSKHDLTIIEDEPTPRRQM